MYYILINFRVVIIDDEKKVKLLLSDLSKLKYLKHIVIINNLSKCVLKELQSLTSNIQLHLFNELINLGKKNLVDDFPPKPDDTCIIW